VIDSDFPWQAQDWRGRPWTESVFLELHVGTFSEQGTFRGAIDKLDHVASAGFTAIELMPVADFFGRWNWGYDGVLLFAPDSVYGRPDDLKTLIDAAHRRGLMVFLDVVYNHFGPEGNYLGRIAPQVFTPANTPWGSAIDYERPEVRRFAVENALYWLGEFRFDGLRLDAVHAISEPGRTPLLKDISEAAGALAARTGRHIHLVLENDDNQAALLDPAADPPQGQYRAQWNDDYHHAFHVMLTGETHGYYGDYRDAGQTVARCLAEGFAYQGETSSHRKGEARGTPTTALPGTAFVNFLQNHDQIGNRALGERLADLAEPAVLEAALAITLLAPGAPLMFMGDEWGAREPFPFFCDFKGELAEAVRSGRRREFAEAYEKYHDEVPDPLSEQTVRLATLDWSKVAKPEHAKRLDLVRRLLAARKTFVVPRLPQLQAGHGRAEFSGDVLTASWDFRTGETLGLLANLSDSTQPQPQSFRGEPVWGGRPPAELPPWSVFAAIGAR
jgi:malto-oligosyltrehalose trehalohydrolase